MKLLALGVDHRSAPTSIREQLAFDEPAATRALIALRDRFPSVEFVVLSTCNRVEIYAAAPAEIADTPDVAELVDWLGRFHHLDPEVVSSHVVAHHDEAVVGHLFRVASSLESVVLGEGQILGQVRDAYKLASTTGLVGPILHEVFREAIRVGKRVREETGMDRGRLSVASVAVDLAREVFDSFRDKTVLVIGAGKMAELTLRHLASLRPGRILVTNRNSDRAADLAQRFDAEPRLFEALFDSLVGADLIVSTTASEEPVVDLAAYQRVQHARRHRLALILDIAVPRDFDERIGTLDQVLLYNVDDLRSQVERNLAERRRGIDPAQAIIEQESAACLSTLRNRRHAGAVLRELGVYADSVLVRELDKLFSLCPDLNEPQRLAIQQFARRLQTQFLHHPRRALKEAAQPGPDTHDQAGTSSIVETVKQIFGLDHAREH